MSECELCKREKRCVFHPVHPRFQTRLIYLLQFHANKCFHTGPHSSLPHHMTVRHSLCQWKPASEQAMENE